MISLAPSLAPAVEETWKDVPSHDVTDKKLFRYGWRYVLTRTNGEEEWERVPLTLEDVLHPQMEDFRMQSDGHYRLCHYLYTVLRSVMEREAGGLVLHDVLIEWGLPGMRGHGPDIVVFTDVQKRPEHEAFDVATMGGRPLLIMEVTSRSTRQLDVAPPKGSTRKRTKFRHYAQVGVPVYIVVDDARRRGGQAPTILGYELVNGRYEALAANGNGWIWVGVMRLWLGPRGERVAWYDADGQPIGDYEDERATRIAAERQARDAQALADQEKARADRLEEELRRLRGEKGH